jgi:poly(A) polymerase
MRFGDASRMKESTFKKFVRMPKFDEHIALHRLDCLGSFGSLASYDFVRDRVAAMPPEMMRPAPLVTGRDLLDMGLTPGPRFKVILSIAEDAQLEGTLLDREEALRWLREYIQKT